jgi:uncharacterized membrane-anchored protein
MTPARKLAIVVSVQLLVLFGVLGFKQYTVLTSDTVLLKVQAADPRALVSHSAAVTFDISSIAPGDAAWDRDAPRCCDALVYVELQRQDDGYWTAIAVHGDRTHTRDGTVLIKGHVQSPPYVYEPASLSQPLELRYGIEQIYIPEGSGADIPSGTGHTVAVEVKVDRFGNAVPRRFVIDEKPVDLRRR